MIRHPITIGLIFLFALMATASLWANGLSLNRYFSDNMVLQRDKPMVIRGSADEGAEVTVEFSGQKQSTQADGKGWWRVTLAPISASSEPATLRVTSNGKTVSIDNVVVGDVFLHARQTSVDISLGKDEAGRKAAESYNENPMFRAMTVKAIPASDPLRELAKDATTGWHVVDKKMAVGMAASAFYLGRDIVKTTDVPIGIIDVNLGHHFSSFWLSRKALMETGKFYKSHKKDSANTEVADAVTQHEKMLAARKGDEQSARGGTGDSPSVMQRPLFPYAGYRGTILPLAGTGLKAVVLQLGNDYPYGLYQQVLESAELSDFKSIAKTYEALDEVYWTTYTNRKYGFRQADKIIPRIPTDWRAAIGDEDLPFGLIVPPGSHLSTMGQHNREMRELQRLVTEDTPNVSVILPGTEHRPFSAQPADDALLAKRCLSWLKGAVYEKPEMPAGGPLFDRMEASFNQATIHFKEGTADGLKAQGNALDYFEVAGVEGDYSPAKATVDGQTIRLQSDTVLRIARVRYNWNTRPDQGLVNAAGLPAFPFRTERVRYDGNPRNAAEVLPEEYSLPADEWKQRDLTLINAKLKGNGYSNFSGCIGPAGFVGAPFGPNMAVREVLEGSPADGKLLVEDIIHSANGKQLGEKAWETMAAAITESETRQGKGKLVLGVRRGSDLIDVELQLKVMGKYSPTAPYDCPKTEKIVEDLERWIVANGGGPGFLNYDAAFMLATGNPRLLGYVRRAVYEILEKQIPEGELDGRECGKSWHNSAEAYLLGEYYLATGDRNVLAHLQYACDRLAATQNKHVGGWRHNYPGGSSYGMIPNAGLPGVMGMYFADEAGVEIDIESYRLAINHFTTGRAETGTMIYGTTQSPRPPAELPPADVINGTLWTYNGGVSCAGILMRFVDNKRAASRCSLISTYAYNNTHKGHGGNFWNNFWTPLGAHEAGKDSFIHFWKGHRWYRETSRMYDGSLIGGGQTLRGGHGKASAGFGIPLVAPRQRIQITGAPPSPFATSATESLKPAVEAYGERDYAKAAKLARALIDAGTVGMKDLATVEYFVRAATEIPLSIDADLARMQKLIDDGDPWTAKTFLAGLRGVMNKDDERLLAMQRKLADLPRRPRQQNENKKAKSADKPRQWERLVRDCEVSRSGPQGDKAAERHISKASWEKASRWKLKIIEGMNQAPRDWFEPRFDDSNWGDLGALPISWHMYHSALLRTTFNVQDKDRFDGLRLRAYVLWQQGVEIYLNGEKIGIISQIGNSTEIADVFNVSALKHLRNGQNTLAIKTTHNWRWGHRFPYVYNGGFDFNLDARLKESR